jgi:hypothetical protein
MLTADVSFAGFSRLDGQEKERSERPDSQQESRNHPEILSSSAVAGDHTTQNGVKKMHETRSADQRRWVHVRFDEKQSGEITEDVIEIHARLLTLPSSA